MRIKVFKDNFNYKDLFLLNITDLSGSIIFAIKEDTGYLRTFEVSITPSSISFDEESSTSTIPTLSRTNDISFDFVRIPASPVNRTLRLTFYGYKHHLENLNKLYNFIQEYYEQLDNAYSFKKDTIPFLIFYNRMWGKDFYVEPQHISFSEDGSRKGIYIYDFTFTVMGNAATQWDKERQHKNIKSRLEAVKQAINKARSSLNDIRSKINWFIGTVNKFLQDFVLSPITMISDFASSMLSTAEQLLSTVNMLNQAVLGVVKLPTNMMGQANNLWNEMKSMWEQWSGEWSNIGNLYENMKDAFSEKDYTPIILNFEDLNSSLNTIYYQFSTILYTLSNTLPDAQFNFEKLQIETLPNIVSFELPNFDLNINMDNNFSLPDWALILNTLDVPDILPEKVDKLKALYPGMTVKLPANNVLPAIKQIITKYEIPVYGVDLYIDTDNLTTKYFIDTTTNILYTYYVWGRFALYQWVKLFFEPDVNFPFQNYGLKNIDLQRPNIVPLQLKNALLRDPRIQSVENISVSRDGKIVSIDIKEVKYL